MRIIVFGNRDFMRRDYVFGVLDALHMKSAITEIIEGGCSGADELGREWGEKNGIKVTEKKAEWDEWAKKGNRLAAGPVRNRQMAELHPEMAVGFSYKPLAETKGTKSMFYIAKEFKIPTHIFYPEV